MDEKDKFSPTNNRGLAARLRAATLHSETKTVDPPEEPLDSLEFPSALESSHLFASDLFASQLSQTCDNTNLFGKIDDEFYFDHLRPTKIYPNPDPSKSHYPDESQKYPHDPSKSIDTTITDDVQRVDFPNLEPNLKTSHSTESIDLNSELEQKAPSKEVNLLEVSPKDDSQINFNDKYTKVIQIEPSVFSEEALSSYLNDSLNKNYSALELQKMSERIQSHLVTLLPFKPSAPFQDASTCNRSEDLFSLHYTKLKTRLPGLPDNILYKINKKLITLSSEYAPKR